MAAGCGGAGRENADAKVDVGGGVLSKNEKTLREPMGARGAGTNRRTLLVLSLLGASVVFALLALYCLLTDYSILNYYSIYSCMNDAASPCYSNLVPIWLYQSFGDMSIGFFALTGLALLEPVIVPRVPKGPKVSVPRIARVVALVGALAGLVALASFDIVDLFSFNPARLGSLGPRILGSYYNASWVNLNLAPYPYSLDTIGLNAFITLLASASCVFVYRLREGVFPALAKAVTLLAAPAVMAFEIGLLLFGPFYMPVHAMRILASYPYAAAVVTNWFVLIVASYLTFLGVWGWRQARIRGARGAPRVG